MNDDDSLLLRPFFDDKATSSAIRRQQSVAERVSWARYFEIYGCLRCGERDAIHVGCGCCRTCYLLIASRKKRILWDEMRERDEGRQHITLIHPGEKRTLPMLKNPRPPKLPRLFRAVCDDRICWCISWRDPVTRKPHTKWLGNVKKVTKAQAEAKKNRLVRQLGLDSRSLLLASNISPSPEADQSGTSKMALVTGLLERPGGGILVAQAKAETHSAATVTVEPPLEAKKPRVKPTVYRITVKQFGSREYWRISFRHEGHAKTHWVGRTDKLTQEQAQTLADAWLMEHHPEFFNSIQDRTPTQAQKGLPL